jgi:hypothetical protein
MNTDEKRALKILQKSIPIEETIFRKWCENDVIHKGVIGKDAPIRIANLYLVDAKGWNFGKGVNTL